MSGSVDPLLEAYLATLTVKPVDANFVGFVISLVYGSISLAVYILVCFIIFKNKRVFRGSYYHIFFFNAIVNMITYLNSLIVLRLPVISCYKCYFSFMFKGFKPFPGINFFNWLCTHMAYVQYLMILSFILNRLTAVLRPFLHEKLWNKYLLWLMGFNFVYPVIFTNGFFFVDSFYMYSLLWDNYVMVTYPPQCVGGESRCTAGNCVDLLTNTTKFLYGNMIIITAISTVFMVFTMSQYKGFHQDRSSERKLLIFSLVYFLIEAFCTSVMVCSSLSQVKNNWVLGQITYYMLPYVSDLLTFSSPYILIICSESLQKSIVALFMGKGSSQPSSIISIR